eukprot:GHUV01026577.1.p1 GENE.GHUV01026577.1~~GHUV01026577.1.p1  ORF type:complete len:385 (+),score=143.23 GHUV01026577.1:779-1933(+)
MPQCVTFSNLCLVTYHITRCMNWNMFFTSDCCNEQGKSTVIVHRLVDRELAFQAALEAEAGEPEDAAAVQSTATTRDSVTIPARGLHLPQLLVTRSDKLCSKLAKEVQAGLATSTYKQSGHTTSSSKVGSNSNTRVQLTEVEDVGNHLVDTAAIISAQARAELPSRFYDLKPTAYPLVITMRDLVNMLNESMPQPFRPGDVSSSNSSSRRRLGQRRLGQNPRADTICDSSSSSDSLDSEGDSSDSDVASSCGSHNDSEFSIEGDDSGNTANSSAAVLPQSRGTSFGINYEQANVPKDVALSGEVEVDFALFASRYWSRVDATLKKEFEASLVFAEIQGTIKGSEGSLASKRGWLSESQYLALSGRRCGNLTDEQRKRVYRIFLR